MVRIPLISDRSAKVTATEDENDDGRVDARDDRIAEDRVIARAKVDERVAARHRMAAGTTVAAEPATERMAPQPPVVEQPVTTTANSDVVTAPIGPRPRASLISTLALVFGLVAALTVLTGTLVGPGIALGVVGTLFGVVGIGATNRRHVAGKADAMLGLLLGVAAVAVGIAAFNGMLPWLSADTDQVGRVRDWLAGHWPWLFPST